MTNEYQKKKEENEQKRRPIYDFDHVSYMRLQRLTYIAWFDYRFIWMAHVIQYSRYIHHPVAQSTELQWQWKEKCSFN